MFKQVHATFCTLYDAQEASRRASDLAGPGTVAGEYAAAASRLLENADLRLAAQDLGGATGETRTATKLLRDAGEGESLNAARILSNRALRQLEELHR